MKGKFKYFIICMQAFLIAFFLNSQPLYASEMGDLYAASAVLMDGDSGRILFEKNGNEFMANASTTKILTCILALENGNLTDVVTVSAYAQTMPDVQLNLREGERYRLEDLLLSLMLESHNDSAVAIAEHIGGSCEEFSRMMNKKAEEIGCKNTFFLTPNGLDAVSGERFHGTTAGDLALLMRYCIQDSPKKDEFLRITRTLSHNFTDVDKKRNFTCQNRNSFLGMMEGALSGKTGFTSKAGYCYVGALSRNGKTYIVALLACGWPGNKHYKWEDTRKLMEFGLEYYDICDISKIKTGEELLKTEVLLAQGESFDFSSTFSLTKEELPIHNVLLKKGEKITVKIKKKKMTAPVASGENCGEIIYYIDGKEWMKQNLYIGNDIKKIDYSWCLKKVLKLL